MFQLFSEGREARDVKINEIIKKKLRYISEKVGGKYEHVYIWC